jgi:hypothetical protein
LREEEGAGFMKSRATMRTGAWGVVLGAGAALSLACSSSSGGGQATANVSGTIQGRVVSTNDAVGLSSSSGSSEAAVGAIITSVRGACSVLQSHGNPSSASALLLAVSAKGGSVPDGTYVVVPGGQFGATASFSLTDADCNQVENLTATGGSITLTSTGGSAIAGSFDLTFGTDEVKGTFSAPICSYTPVSADAGASTCM